MEVFEIVIALLLAGIALAALARRVALPYPALIALAGAALALVPGTPTIGDAAFQRVEQELDWSELDVI